ncbi:MAG: dethiobiotin synthase [Lonepinella koalarum]|nr:dethiobiotin synthase [Lonepinella koalarum]
MSCFFVTGTDTGVGKTVSSRAIIQALQKSGVQIVGFKPIACGCNEPVYSDHISRQEGDYSSQDNADVMTLLNSTQENVTYEEINSYTFSHKMPMLTEDSRLINIDKINRDLEALNSRYQSVLVEGSFGWLTPINRSYSFADWIKEKKMPVVLVVGIKEGCIDHALMTTESILAKGVPLLGWVANRINPCLSHYAEIIEVLQQKINAPLLGEIPYLHKPEERDLGKYLNNIDRLMYMKTIHE